MQPSSWAVHPEVQQALEAGQAVVALESTLFAHGLPGQAAPKVWSEVEGAVRDAGAVPAVIAVMEGKVRVGLDQAAWAKLGQGAEKAGLQDLGRLLAQGKTGATTVASTAFLAWKTGIGVMATGGIGGVHRENHDISADLPALALYPMVVVCSGAKSVLDLPATVEALETLGIPVMGFRTPRFPGFYLAETDFSVPAVQDEREVAQIVQCARALGLSQAVLVVQAPPEPLDRETHDRALHQALEEGRARGIRGKALTPFLLERLHQLTGGESVEANRKLVVANARLAARIARHLAPTG